MSKLITIAGRAGSGITTVASMCAELLEKIGSTLIISMDGFNIYGVEQSMDIRPFMIINDVEKTKKAIQDCATEIRKNLYYISGCPNDIRLDIDEINAIYNLNVFDYIVVDGITNKNADMQFIVINPNISEYEQFVKVDSNIRINVVINKYDDGIEFKSQKDSYLLYFSSEITNFSNGYELRLKGHNKKELQKIIEKITGLKNIRDKVNINKWGKLIKKDSK